uniref:uncharacterized protein LOC120337346 n=1 Tax=Styela clava TaxID=7725 RepID=UPI00193A6731|nr:uncharacterized protein LOC120337346 [Styela clava]
MGTKTFLLIALLSVLVFNESEAWRFGRIFRSIKRTVSPMLGGNGMQNGPNECGGGGGEEYQQRSYNRGRRRRRAYQGRRRRRRRSRGDNEISEQELEDASDFMDMLADEYGEIQAQKLFTDFLAQYKAKEEDVDDSAKHLFDDDKEDIASFE